MGCWWVGIEWDLGRSCEGLGWTDDGFSGEREVFNTDRGTSNRDSGYRRCPKLNIWDQRSTWVARAEWDNGHDISVWWATHLDFISNSHLRNGGGISAGRNKPLVQARVAIRSCHNPKSFFVCRLCELTNLFCSSAIRFLALILPPLPHLSTPPRPMTDHTKSFSSTVFNSLAPALIPSAAPCPSAIDRSHPYLHSLFLLSPHLVPRSHATVGSRPRQFDRLPLRSYSF